MVKGDNGVRCISPHLYKLNSIFDGIGTPTATNTQLKIINPRYTVSAAMDPEFSSS